MDTRMHYLTLFTSAASGASGLSKAHRVIARELAEWVLMRGYCNAGTGPDYLAERTGYTREEISSFLWNRCGERFLTIRKHLRIADARKMIVERKDIPLSAVSRAVGFPDRSDFRRAFKEETGYTPQYWRENGGSSLRCRVARILDTYRSRCHGSCKTS